MSGLRGGPIVGGVSTSSYQQPAAPMGSLGRTQNANWAAPQAHNELINAALKGNQSALGAVGSTIALMGGGIADIAQLLNTANRNALTGGVSRAPVATVSQPRLVMTAAPSSVTYNQPFNYNNQQLSYANDHVQLPNPVAPSMPEAMRIDTPRTVQFAQADPITMGVQSLPMAAARTAPVQVTAAAASNPENLLGKPQQAKMDQVPTPQSAPDQLQPQSRPLIAPPAQRSDFPQVNPPTNPWQPPIQQRYGGSMPVPMGTPAPRGMPTYAQSYGYRPEDFQMMAPQQRFYNPGIVNQKRSFMQRFAGAISPVQRNAQATEGKARYEYAAKLAELDQKNQEAYSGNLGDMMRRDMQNQGDYTTGMHKEILQGQYGERKTHIEKQYDLIKAEADKKLNASQGWDIFSQAMNMEIKSPQDLARQSEMLQAASQGTGMDLMRHVGQTSPEGATAAQKRALGLKQDAANYEKALGDIVQQPYELAAKKSGAALAANDVGMIPVENAAKRGRAQSAVAGGVVDAASVASDLKKRYGQGQSAYAGGTVDSTSIEADINRRQSQSENSGLETVSRQQKNVGYSVELGAKMTQQGYILQQAALQEKDLAQKAALQKQAVFLLRQGAGMQGAGAQGFDQVLRLQDSPARMPTPFDRGQPRAPQPGSDLPVAPRQGAPLLDPNMHSRIWAQAKQESGGDLKAAVQRAKEIQAQLGWAPSKVMTASGRR